MLNISRDLAYSKVYDANDVIKSYEEAVKNNGKKVLFTINGPDNRITPGRLYFEEKTGVVVIENDLYNGYRPGNFTHTKYRYTYALSPRDFGIVPVMLADAKQHRVIDFIDKYVDKDADHKNFKNGDLVCAIANNIFISEARYYHSEDNEYDLICSNVIGITIRDRYFFGFKYMIDTRRGSIFKSINNKYLDE